MWEKIWWAILCYCTIHQSTNTTVGWGDVVMWNWNTFYSGRNKHFHICSISRSTQKIELCLTFYQQLVIPLSSPHDPTLQNSLDWEARSKLESWISTSFTFLKDWHLLWLLSKYLKVVDYNKKPMRDKQLNQYLLFDKSSRFWPQSQVIFHPSMCSQNFYRRKKSNDWDSADDTISKLQITYSLIMNNHWKLLI